MKKQRYPMTRAAEVQVAFAMATLPRFYELLGHAIEWERMPSEDAQFCVSASQDIARESGVPCASSVVLAQNLRLRVNNGKMTMEQLAAVEDLLLTAADCGGVEDLEGLINVIAPAVVKQGFRDAVEQAIQDVGTGVNDVGETVARFDKLKSLGKARVSVGSTATWTKDDIISSAISTIRDPLPTGIPELDIALGGGIERASLACFLGGPGDGKSLSLCHVAAEAIYSGWGVAYVTAELSESAIKQRIYANILNMSPHEMQLDPDTALLRRQAIDGHLASTNKPAIGSFRVLYVTPKIGTVVQIASWLKDLERDYNERPNVLIVDYADKLAAKAGSEERSSYNEQGTVYEQLRSLIIARDSDDFPSWGITASQTTGRQGRKKKPDIEDMADSMQKARIVDTLIAIMRTEEDTQNGSVRFRLPKRRNGAAHLEVGPLQMDPEHGRMVLLTRETPW